MFVTAWIGFLNTKTGVVTYANAGHNPPLVKHEDGSFTYLKSRPGFVLAGMEGVRYRKNEIQLMPGDAIYLYTDGVTEATNAENELYGEERLLHVMNQKANLSSQELCEAVKADVDVFVGEAPQFDDITMLCLNYLASDKKEEKGREIKELTTKAAVENIEVVTDFINEQLESMDCPMKVQMQIDVAVDEIFGNICHYAYPLGEGEATVCVEVQEEPKAVVMTFMDSGVPYNPLEKEEPDTTLSAEEREIGGLGIFIVKKTMDEISYRYENEKNILTVKKYME